MSSSRYESRSSRRGFGVPNSQRHVYGRDVAVVQVLAHVRDVVGLGLVAVLDIGIEAVLYEVFENLFRCFGPAPVEMAHRSHASVELHVVQDLPDVRQVEAVVLHVQGLLLDRSRFELDQELVEVFSNPGPQGSRRVLLFVRRELDRHHDLGLDLHDETIGSLGHLLAPLLSGAAGSSYRRRSGKHSCPHRAPLRPGSRDGRRT